MDARARVAVLKAKAAGAKVAIAREAEKAAMCNKASVARKAGARAAVVTAAGSIELRNI